MGAKRQRIARPERARAPVRTPRKAERAVAAPAQAAALAGVWRMPHVPATISPDLVLMLQRTAGNAAVNQLLRQQTGIASVQRTSMPAAFGPSAQRLGAGDDERGHICTASCRHAGGYGPEAAVSAGLDVSAEQGVGPEGDAQQRAGRPVLSRQVVDAVAHRPASAASGPGEGHGIVVQRGGEETGARGDGQTGTNGKSPEPPLPTNPATVATTGIVPLQRELQQSDEGWWYDDQDPIPYGFESKAEAQAYADTHRSTWPRTRHNTKPTKYPGTTGGGGGTPSGNQEPKKSSGTGDAAPTATTTKQLSKPLPQLPQRTNPAPTTAESTIAPIVTTATTTTSPTDPGTIEGSYDGEDHDLDSFESHEEAQADATEYLGTPSEIKEPEGQNTTATTAAKPRRKPLPRPKPAPTTALSTTTPKDSGTSGGGGGRTPKSKKPGLIEATAHGAKKRTVEIVGTNRQMAKRVAKSKPNYDDPQMQELAHKATNEYQRLKDAWATRDKSHDLTAARNRIFQGIPEHLWPPTEATMAPEERAVRANKEAFLEEDIEKRFQRERKRKHILESSVKYKFELGPKLEAAKKGSVERAVIDAMIEAVEDDKFDKLDHESQDRRLEEAALNARMKYYEESLGKGKVLGMRVPWQKSLAPHEKINAILGKQEVEEKRAEIEGPKNELKMKKQVLKDRKQRLNELLRSKNTNHNGKEMLEKQLEETDKELTEVRLKLKGLEPQKQSFGSEDPGDKNAAKAATGLGAISNAAQGGSYGTKEAASYGGGGGAGLGAAAAEMDVAYLASVGTDLTELSDIYQIVQDDNSDPALKKQAKQRFYIILESLGAKAQQVAYSTTGMVGDFVGGSTAAVMAADVLPALGIGSAAYQLAVDGIKIGLVAKRLRGQDERIGQATKAGDTHIATSIKQFQQQNEALGLKYGTSICLDIGKIVSGAVSLSGFGAFVGEPLKLGFIGASLIKTATEKVRENVKTGKMHKVLAMERQGAPMAAEKLLKYHPKHASQTLIREAKAGNEVAKKELKAMGIGKKTLAGSSDQHIRSLILYELETKEDAKTLGQQISDAHENYKEWKHYDKLDQIKLLAQVKNKLEYGGVKDRGVGWTIKEYLVAYDPKETAQIHAKLVEMGEAGRKARGITEEEFNATATLYERGIQKRESSLPHVTISSPTSTTSTTTTSPPK